MEPNDCSESSVQNYYHPLHNPEKHSSHLLRGRNLKTWLLNFYRCLGVDVLLFLYTENKATSSSKMSETIYHLTWCCIPVTILCELQISQTVIFPSLYSSLIPITMFTQCPLNHIQHHINPVHIRKLCCFKIHFGFILISNISKCRTVSRKILKKGQDIGYVLCMYVVYWLHLSAMYYYKLTITSFHLLFPNSDKSCSKTG
jgi:hypothetical protein